LIATSSGQIQFTATGLMAGPVQPIKQDIPGVGLDEWIVSAADACRLG
jgi:hypothetical protein